MQTWETKCTNSSLIMSPRLCHDIVSSCSLCSNDKGHSCPTARWMSSSHSDYPIALMLVRQIFNCNRRRSQSLQINTTTYHARCNQTKTTGRKCTTFTLVLMVYALVDPKMILKPIDTNQIRIVHDSRRIILLLVVDSKHCRDVNVSERQKVDVRSLTK